MNNRQTVYNLISTNYGVDRDTAKLVFYKLLYNADAKRIGETLEIREHEYADALKTIQSWINLSYAYDIEKSLEDQLTH